MTRIKWAIILVGLISIGTFAQSTDKNRATLEKLSETLKSKNIWIRPLGPQSMYAFQTARKPFQGGCASSRLAHGNPKFGHN